MDVICKDCNTAMTVLEYLTTDDTVTYLCTLCGYQRQQTKNEYFLHLGLNDIRILSLDLYTLFYKFLAKTENVEPEKRSNIISAMDKMIYDIERKLIFIKEICGIDNFIGEDSTIEEEGEL